MIGVAWELLQDRLQRLNYREFGFQTEEEMQYHGEFFLFGMTAMRKKKAAASCDKCDSLFWVEYCFSVIRMRTAVDGSNVLDGRYPHGAGFLDGKYVVPQRRI